VAYGLVLSPMKSLTIFKRLRAEQIDTPSPTWTLYPQDRVHTDRES